MPSVPGLPRLALTRFKARKQLSRSQTASITCSAGAGLSTLRFAVDDSVPPRRAFGASLLPSPVKASTICSRFFCRLSPIESRELLAAPFPFGPSLLAQLLCPLLTSVARSGESLPPQSRFRDTPQTSRGKFDRLPRTTAGFTTSSLDGSGLRGRLPARPLP